MPTEQKEVDFRTRNLVFIDVETTGLDPHKHEIIEVSAIVVDGQTLEVISRFTKKIKPKNIEKANPESLKVNGYSEERWMEAEEPEVGLKELCLLSPGGILVGWNVYFDWEFIRHSFASYGLKPNFDYHLLDVQSMVYPLIHKNPAIKGLGTRKVAPFLGVTVKEGYHEAETDINATYQIFLKLMGK